MFHAVLTKPFSYIDHITGKVKSLPNGEKVVISVVKPGSTVFNDARDKEIIKKDMYMLFHKSLLSGRAAVMVDKSSFKTVD